MRRTTSGSLVLAAFWRVPPIPMVTANLCWSPVGYDWSCVCVQDVSKSNVQTSIALMGPDLVSFVLKARWALPKSPVHLFPFPGPLQASSLLPNWTEPVVSSHVMSMSCGPELDGTVSVPCQHGSEPATKVQLGSVLEVSVTPFAP